MTDLDVTVDARDVIERKADSTGRINIGSEHAGKQVTVAIVEVNDE